MAEVVGTRLGLSGELTDQLVYGSADPDLPLAERAAPDRATRGKHHAGAGNYDYVAKILMGARQRWLRGQQAAALYECGVSLHYLVDALVPNGGDPRHAQIERHCVRYMQGQSRARSVYAPEQLGDCSARVRAYFNACPLRGRGREEEMVTTGIAYAHYVTACVCAPQYAPVDRESIARKYIAELASTERSIRYDVAVRECAEKKAALNDERRHRARLHSQAMDAVEQRLSILHVPISVVALAGITLIAKPLHGWLVAQYFGWFESAVVVALATLLLAVACLHTAFGPLPRALLGALWLSITALRVHLKTRGEYTESVRQYRDAAFSLAWVIRQYARGLGRIRRDFSSEWDDAHRPHHGWYLPLPPPNLAAFDAAHRDIEAARGMVPLRLRVLSALGLR